jgi:uncharacterized protein (TIGR03790 family)
VAVARNHRVIITLMRSEKTVMKRDRWCFVAWRFAATLWLLTGAESAWPVTLIGDVAPDSEASATDLGVDTTTSGNWTGQYGSEGYIIPNSSTNLPNYVQLRLSADIANKTCSDDQCLETADRMSRTWNSWQASTFTIDININDGKTHKISLYAYDAFHTGGILNFTIKAAGGSAVLSSHELSSFFNGAYQIWQISGHVTIVVKGTTPPIPAIINGLFFDPPSPLTATGHLTMSASAGATPMRIGAPSDPNYSPSQLSVRVTALPEGGRVTLSDGVTPVRVHETLTVAQLTSLKFVPSTSATITSTFAYTVTNPAAGSTPGSVLIAAEVVPAPPPRPSCSAAGMEAAPVVRNDLHRAISLLVPRTSMIPSDVAVLINDGDPQSIVVGQYFQLRHAIPDANMIHLRLPITPTKGANYAISTQEFAALKGQVEAQLGENIQAYAITWTQPYMVSGGVAGAVGITSAFTYGYDGAAARPSRYFNSATYHPYIDLHIRPAMMLAGYTPQDIVSLIDRGVSAQNILPTGNGYLIRTTDARRSDTRYAAFRAVFGEWNRRNGLNIMFIDNSEGTGRDYIENTPHVLFYQTGLERVPAIDSNQYVPGALADHLTSFGGDLLATSQMSILDWIRAGATASYGTVTEPTNNPAKFPQPEVLVSQYFYGNTALEAYNKSVLVPYQGIFVGEPLARPFGTKADFTDGVLSIKTSILKKRIPYSLIAGKSCSGPFTTLQSNISVSPDSYTIIRDSTGFHPYYELIEN